MSSGGRVEELDAVRGIAAMVVVLHHCWQTVLPDQNTFPFVISGEPISPVAPQAAFWVSLSPLRLLFAGHAAVGVFFVLSGFVLTKSLQSSTRVTYFPFIIRRFFRIWLPFAGVILCAAAAAYFIPHAAIPHRPWINESWNTPITWGLVLGHLLMLGFGPYVNLDNPIWSLVYELRISLIFPFLYLFTTRAPRLMLGASAIAFLALSINRLVNPIAALIDAGTTRELLLSGFQTVRYGLFFMLGIQLALYLASIGIWLETHSRIRPTLWLVVAVLLWIPNTAGYLDSCYAVGACGLLALCIYTPRVRTALRHRALAWLGRVSYSLYLVHLVILLSLIYLLNGIWPIYAILPLGIVVSLITAELTNRYLELPCNDFGKRLAARFATRPTSLAVLPPDSL